MKGEVEEEGVAVVRVVAGIFVDGLDGGDGGGGGGIKFVGVEELFVGADAHALEAVGVLGRAGAAAVY